MYIYRYKADSATGFERIQVEDGYQLQKGELKKLPYPCYTPMKLDSAGNLVSATVDESNAYAKDHIVTSTTPSQTQQIIATMTVQVTQLGQQVQSLQTVVKSQSQLIEKMMNKNTSSNTSTTEGSAKS